MIQEKWKIIDTGVASAEKNMALDIQLLEDLCDRQQQQPILHLYDWEAPSATYGYFIDPSTLLHLEGVAAAGMQLARRPTGGGIIFHVSDFAFSLLVPASHFGYSVNTLENYAFVNAFVIEAVHRFTDGKFPCSLLPAEPLAIDANARHFCMAKPTKYDVVMNGRKVGGGAQRRKKEGFLHQGTISLALPQESFLRQVLLPGTCVIEGMQMHTGVLLDDEPDPQGITIARLRIKEIFKDLAETKN